jgi:hypothetical protein
MNFTLSDARILVFLHLTFLLYLHHHPLSLLYLLFPVSYCFPSSAM